MVGFSGILGTVEEWKMDDERQINRWKKIVSRFRGKLEMLVANLMIIQFRLKLDKFIALGLQINSKRFF